MTGPIDIGADQASPSASSDIGTGDPAPQVNLPAARGGEIGLHGLLSRHRAVLLSFVNASSLLGALPRPTPSAAQMVVLKSMSRQYGSRGITVLIVGAHGGHSSGMASRRQLLNLSFDWQLPHIPMLLDAGGFAARQYSVVTLPTTFLIGENGRILHRWDGYVPAAPLSFALEEESSPSWHQ